MSLSDDGEGSDVVSNGEIEICKSLLHDCIRLVVAVTTNSEGFDDCICAVFVLAAVFPSMEEVARLGFAACLGCLFFVVSFLLSPTAVGWS